MGRKDGFRLPDRYKERARTAVRADEGKFDDIIAADKAGGIHGDFFASLEPSAVVKFADLRCNDVIMVEHDRRTHIAAERLSINDDGFTAIERGAAVHGV